MFVICYAHVADLGEVKGDQSIVDPVLIYCALVGQKVHNSCLIGIEALPPADTLSNLALIAEGVSDDAYLSEARYKLITR
jgi:hypothetical protein